MRIISGRLRGRTLKPDASLPVRPTTDFAKTGLFNILSNRFDFEDCRFLDLFAGTGNISFEAASRGCADVFSVEKDVRCARYIEKNKELLGITNMRVIKADAKSFCASLPGSFDIVFADPPYDSAFIPEIPDWIFQNGVLAPEGQFILEHSEYVNFEAHTQWLETRKYGNVRFSFFIHPESE